jgi:hypothetical protein
VSEQARLERRYRRLLACYPWAFRRENEEEILAVLLACAQQGQQRPGLAPSADLIKGAIQVRLRPARGQPHSVRIGIRLMCAGAAAHLAVLITIVATAGSLRSAVARGYPGLAAAQPRGERHPGHRLRRRIARRRRLAGADLGAHARTRLGQNRPGGGLRLDHPDDARRDRPARRGIRTGRPDYRRRVEWLIALSACVLLFTRTSGRFYHPEPRAVTLWRGTFGTM